MDTEADALRQPNDTQTGGKSWGAQDSLRRNARLDMAADDSEATPLLGNGGSSAGSSVNETGGQEWEGAADFEGLTWWHTPSMWWLLPPFFMFSLAVGGLMVPKLNLILALVCRRYLQERGVTDPNFIFAPVLLDSDNPQCRIPEVQALVTKFNLYLMVIAGMLSAVMAPKLGALSDRYGRKKLLAVTGVGLFVTEVATILAYKFPDTVHYNWLLAGAVVDGLCGSFTAGMAITHAYASDCTPPPKRAVAFGYFHACLFSGIALGPLMAAFLVKVTGSLITIFYVALAISSSYFVFVLFFIPESLAMKRQLAAREKFAADGDNIIWDGYTWLWALRKSNFLGPLKILWPTGSGSSGHLRLNLVLLAAVDTTVFGVAMGAATVVVYYTGYRFGWETSGTSAYISIVNACRVSGLVIILPLLNYIFRTRRANRQRRESGFAVPESNSGSDIIDLNIIRASIILEVIGYAGYALAGTGPLFVVSGIIAAFGGIASPTLQSALTKHVPQDRVGQLLGATGLLHALARIICPTIFNLIYASTVGTLPQTVFVALASSFLIAFLASWFIRPNIYLEETKGTAIDPNLPSADPARDVLVDEEIGGY